MPCPDRHAYYDQIASDYDTHVLSPYALGLTRSLDRDVSNWVEAGGETEFALDLGCGAGQALELIAGRAGLAVGLDYSEVMLEVAAKRLVDAGIKGVSPEAVVTTQVISELATPTQRRTLLVRGDMHELEWAKGRAQLSVASNSITDPSVEAGQHMFGQVAATLAPGGHMLALFPASDSTRYLMDLNIECHGRLPENMGTLHEDGVYEADGLREKFWSEAELIRACAQHGIELIGLEKILFPWAAIEESGWGSFEGEAEVWDWYLHARAPR